MTKIQTTAIAAVLFATAAHAAPVMTEQESQAGSILGLALFVEASCALQVNEAMKEQALVSLGFPNGTWGKNVNVVAGVLASQRNFAKKPTDQFCAEMQAQYGENGTSVRGFLRPK